MSVHIKYPATPKFGQFLYRKDTSESLLTKLIGTVKLHGANVTLVCRPNLPIQVQSRNRVLSAEEDFSNAFQFFHHRSVDQLIEKILHARGITTYNEIIIAGEYAGESIQKGVALVALPIFYAIFAIRIDGLWVGDMRDYQDVEIPEESIFNVVKTGGLFEVTFGNLSEKAERTRVGKEMKRYTDLVAEECPFALQVSTILLGPGKEVRGAGEGIVWTLVSPVSAREPRHFKTKAEKFLDECSTRIPNPRAAKLGDEEAIDEQRQAFIDFACPLDGHRLEQGIEYLREMHGEGNALNLRWTGEFIKWVVMDTMNEEGWRIGSDEEFILVTESPVRRDLSTRAAEWYKEQVRLAS